MLFFALPMNLFVYGTLLVPQIWTLVTSDTFPENEEGSLPGYSIRKVKNASFPAITHTGKNQDIVPGRLLHKIAPETLRSLDAYEDQFYFRTEVEVSTLKGEIIAAETYAVSSNTASRILSSESWTLEWFLRNAYEDYWKAMNGN